MDPDLKETTTTFSIEFYADIEFYNLGLLCYAWPSFLEFDSQAVDLIDCEWLLF